MSSRTTETHEPADASGASTLLRLLRMRAERQPEALAHVFLRDGESDEERITYGELDRRARAVAAQLQGLLAPGERALLLYPPGLEFFAAFYGCLYAGVVAVPAYPPRHNRNLLRLQAVAEDAQAAATLTTTPVLARVAPQFSHNPYLKPLRWLASDVLEEGAEEGWQEPAVSGDSLAFLQYTSGSTGRPKGVMLSHSHLLHNAALVWEAVGHSAGDSYVSWLPIFHDMGFMAGLLQPLYGGLPSVLMSPAAFLQSPVRWLRAITRYRATTSGGPNFAYDLCVRKIAPERRAELDLSSWSVAFNGAEQVRADTLRSFAETFAPNGFSYRSFYPCYGLAEATLMVTGGRKDEAALVKPVHSKALESNLVVGCDEADEWSHRVVGCGRALGGQHVAIVNPETLHECTAGTVGEIWVSGPSVAAGYWNRSEETEQTFRARLAGDGGETTYLRTGDLGFLEAGELYVKGRIKDLVIIRGRNHYPQDIEFTVEHAHAALRPNGGAAFSVEDSGEERLVVVHELEPRADVAEAGSIFESVRRALAEEHEIQAHAIVLIKAGTLPKTSSGKVQRYACREGFLERSLDALAEWREVGPAEDWGADVAAAPAEDVPVAEWLREQLAAKLGVEPSALDPRRPISHYGLDSLAAVELSYAIESGLGAALRMDDFLQDYSIEELAAEISARPAAGARTAEALVAAADGEHEHPLSHGQQALWFLHQLAPDSGAYNLSTAVLLRGEVDTEALERVFQALANRHPSLRTTFHATDELPVQRINEYLPVNFRLEAAGDDEAALRERLAVEARHPFELASESPLRVTLYARASGDHLMQLVMHHLVADLWSLTVLMHELGELYAAEVERRPASLNPLTLHFTDFVRWQQTMLDGDEGEKLWSYWREQLGGELPTLDLPTDRPRPPAQTFRGAAHDFMLDAATTRALRELGHGCGATLYMTLLAAFELLLSRYTNQEELVVGSPTAGRSWKEMSGQVGYLVNPVVLRTNLSGRPTFLELLGRVRRTVLEAFRHQDYPFPLLVERLQPERDPSRSPLFQVMFVLQKTHLREAESLAALAMCGPGMRFNLGRLELESYGVEQRASQFDLTLAVAECGEELAASLQYNTDLFDAATVERMAGHLRTVLAGVIADPARRADEIPLLTPAERGRLLVEWNDTAAPLPAGGACVHELIAQRARLTPEAVALVYRDSSLTYRELEERSERLARHLLAHGLGPDETVAVCLERSAEVLVALLAVLKAGGAYVPLDPSYPPDRLAFMLEDAAPALLITEQRLAQRLKFDEGLVRVYLDAQRAEIESRETGPVPARVGPDNLAYVIYTSGSTGRPKGVMVTHRNVSNFFGAMDERLGGAEPGVWLAVTSVSFDISVLELLWTLARGFKVVVQGEERREARPGARRSSAAELDFSLFYFASDGAAAEGDRYRLLLEGAKFADRQGFSAVWTPERHFHAFGDLYPSPAVTAAAVAAVTERIGIRAGSVVLPLHHSVRVAEEWAMIDNLSRGRVGVSFASGWHADDFIFAPENYADRKRIMVEQIETVRRLWRGEALPYLGGTGREVEIRILPRPVQPELPCWVTAAGDPETFRAAGALGANLLTHLLGQSVAELERNIAIYREARRAAGGEGHVTLMLHTFVGPDLEAVREKVRRPFCNYLRDSLGLIRNLARSLGRDEELSAFSEEDMQALLEHAFERYFGTSALLGTPETCLAMCEELQAAGVDEVACLIDFGIDFDSVMNGLLYLDRVREESRRRTALPDADYSLPALLRRHGVTHFQCTPSMAAMLSADPESFAALRGLKMLLLGGEALPVPLAQHLCAELGADIRNMYGPTETTVWSATAEVGATGSTVPIGRPINNTQVFILDANLSPVPVGVAGEVYIGGVGVARGYLKRPSLSAERFVPNPYGTGPGERMYRTGDLARHLPSGEIEFLGRVDQQVKVRGYRVELEEIEAVLGGHPSVAEAAVVARVEGRHDVRLVAYVVAAQGQPPAVAELRRHLKERLPEYMLPAAFVILDAMPRTPNGKLDRRRLPAPSASSLGSEASYVAPQTPVQEVVAAVWTELLGLERAGIHDNFFELGGHSLLATQVVSRVRQSFKIELPLRSLFEEPTVAGLAEQIERLTSSGQSLSATPIMRAETEAAPVLSFAQQRMWFLDQFEPDRAVYNVPALVRLGGRFDVAAAELALEEIVRRHEVLRTTYGSEAGNPAPSVAPRLGLALPFVNLSALNVAEREAEVAHAFEEEARVPFDLSKGPLLRVRLLRCAEEEHVLLLTLHHIVSDGWSMGILLEEFAALYAAFSAGQPSTLAEPPIQYGDFAAWQREWLRGETLEQQLAYWTDRLRGAPPLLELPTDRPRTPLQAYRRATLEFSLPQSLSESLKELSRREGATLFMTLLAAFKVVLARHSGQTDICVGMPIAGRNRVETENLIGLFLNTLVLRTDLSGAPTFRELLGRLREVSLGAYTHQHLPFEKLVEELQPERDTSRTPLFQVMFVLQNAPFHAPTMPGVNIKHFEVGSRSTNYDLTLSMEDTGSGLKGLLDYNALLFDAETIERLLGHYAHLLSALPAHPDAHLPTLPLLTPTERQHLLVTHNRTTRPDLLAPFRSLPSLFAEMARTRPDATAVVGSDATLTYAELDTLSTRLAHLLLSHSPDPARPIALCLPRTSRMLATLLGVLKAGLHYLPLDATYPQARLRYMLADSYPSLLLTERTLAARFEGCDAELLYLDELWDALSSDTTDAVPVLPVEPDALAYVIYTSGSTGQPKGVMVTHAALSNLLLSMREQPGLGSDDRLLAVTTLGFDIAALELFLPLVVGGVVVVGREGLGGDAAGLATLINEQGVTAMQATPSTWRLLVEGGWSDALSGVKVLCGGEAVDAGLAERLAESGREAWNVYGPTETTIWSATGRLGAGNGRVVVGRPIANTRAYVLDAALNPVPVGVSGELYLAGAGLARGYLKRAGLTAERFVPDPHGGEVGARMYRTGDVARWTVEGEIECLGRVDSQVKVRGYRIELGEIESVLLAAEGVRAAAVVVRGEGSERRLVGYVVREGGSGQEGGEEWVRGLKEGLRERLPEYMVPVGWVELGEMPLTANGKVDRRALPETGEWVGSGAREYEGPGTPVEEMLCGVFGEVLGVERVGVNDSFFELGGHSLLATRLMHRIQAASGVVVPLQEVFERPRVSELAGYVAARQGSEAGTAVELTPIEPRPDERYEPFLLSDVQQAYWIGRGDTFELGNVATHLYLEVEGARVDLARLERAFRRLIERHEMLRAVILPDGRQQILSETPPYHIAVEDLSAETEAGVEAALDSRRERMSHQVLRAERWPLFEVRASLLPGGRTRVHVSFDLLIGDARSFQILTDELRRLYEQEEVELPPLEVSFRDYLLAERGLREAEGYRRAEDYWRARVAELPPAPALPLAKSPAEVGRPRFKRLEGGLDAESWQRLKRRASAQGLTPSAVLLTAFGEVLAAWSKSPRFTLNLTLFNRLPLHAQIDDLVGDFTTLSLLAVDLSKGAPFASEARSLQRQLWSDLDHRQMSGVQVQRELARAQGGVVAPLPVVFTSLLNLAGAGGTTEPGGLGWLGEQVYSITQTPQVWLDQQVYEQAGALGFNWDVVEELFPAGLVQDVFEAYRELLARLAHEEAAWVGAHRPLIPPAQLARRAEINDTAAEVSDELLHTLFAKSAAERPSETAVVTSARRLTYGELDEMSARLATRLRAAGVRPNTLVGVVMEKGWEQVVAVLGVLRAGAAYLPIDPALPSERVRYLLRQGEVETLLTQPWLDENLEWPEGVGRIRVEARVEFDAEPAQPAQAFEAGPSDLAYVIFTSGSTGFPKGVMIDHRGAVNTVLDINRRFGVTADDRVLALSALNFDLSVYDIFGTLAAGGRIVIPDAGTTREPPHWAELVEREGVTIWNSVPALMQILAEYAGGRAGLRLDSLRLVMLSGDWIPLTLPGQIWELLPGAEVFSLGGATEASIWSILYPVETVEPHWKSVPYGHPMVNQTWQVLDERLEPCPVWAVGMLYIGGVGLALGYWRDEEKTGASFIRHPQTGERLYKTGDLGRYLPDGNIEFLGREDTQVKVQGHRIELGEIEAALEQHEGLRACVVSAVGEQKGNKRLVAYVVPTTDGDAPPEDELNRFLSAKLPKYMIPSAYVFLAELPLSANGKVDRRALPAPSETRAGEGFVEAEDEKERVLAEIWAQVLGLERVGVQDNFFELGGDSIISIRLVTKAREAGLYLTPDQVFQHRTVAELASVVAAVASDTHAPAAEQGPVEGTYTLSPPQLWFYSQSLPRPQHWNQALLLALPEPPPPQHLARAVSLLLEHHDALRLRFKHTPDGRRQTYAPPEPEASFEYIDLSALPPVQIGPAIESASAQAQASLDLEHGPLFRALQFHTGAGAADRLLLCAHHLVVDAVSWRVLLEDLSSICAQLEYGGELRLPAKTTSYGEWAQALAEEAEGASVLEEAGYWAGELEGVERGRLPVDFAGGTNTAGSARRVEVTLDEAQTQRLLVGAAEVYRMGGHEVALAALYEALLGWSGRGEAVVDVEWHGREAAGADVSRTVGWMTSIYPVRVARGGGELGERLRGLKEKARGVPRGGRGYGQLRYVRQGSGGQSEEALRVVKESVGAEVSFNYLGQVEVGLGGGGLRMVEAAESAGAVYDGGGERPYLLEVEGRVKGGRLGLSFTYSENLHRRESVEELAEQFVSAARAVIEHCAGPDAGGFTPSDFPLSQLSQADLDSALLNVEFES